ncbi:hypothetical protein QVH35_03350 [Candidatus Nitrosotenuis chungbukensis]|uniref:hypothetical protein n=1 Tax=Candidatus Nitrosotenuis chungbukensis TaxID=1353246 RepID=UPI00267189A5|nr:hypothetical protein [Candidatus Nitrosotenuis chungbukensis]WKT58452.1 hypothetical protein QVH35_03350 [Candidatus Nitrosotenuis chungbukensis]
MEKKLFSRGKECMFILTDRRLAFVSKTEAKSRWWSAAVERQVVTLLKSDDPMLIHDGYDGKELAQDLENKKNEEYIFDNVVGVESEGKKWGSVLKLKLKKDGKEKNYQLSVVKDWVTYPVKDPVKFLKVNWSPIVEFINKQRAK